MVHGEAQNGPMPRLRRAKRSSNADIMARRTRVLDLVVNGRTIDEIAQIEKLKPATIARDYNEALKDVGSVLDRNTRVSLAAESVHRIRRRAQLLFGDRPEHTSHQRHSVGLQAERLLNDILDTAQLLSSGADQARYSAYQDSWAEPAPDTTLTPQAGGVSEPVEGALHLPSTGQPAASDHPAPPSGDDR